MATSEKKKTTGKTTTRKRTTRKTKKQKQRQAWGSIALGGLGLLVAALTYISAQGAAWQALQSSLFGLFGLTTYLLAPLLLYLAVRLGAGLEMRGKVWQAGVLLLLASALLHIFMLGLNTGDTVGAVLTALFKEGALHKGGGVFAAPLGALLLYAFGRPAADITAVVLTLVMVMLLTGITPADVSSFMKRRAGDAKQAFTPPPRQPRNEVPKAAVLARKASVSRPVRLQSEGIDIPLDGDKSVKKGKRAPAPDPYPVDSSDALNSAAYAAAKSAAPAVEAAPADLRLEDLVRAAVGTPSKEEEKAVSAPTPVPAPAPEPEPVDEMARPAYIYPSIELFEKQKEALNRGVEEELKHNADVLVSTLASFGVQTKILNISRGPAVTRYELQPQAGVKVSRITSLADDIALALASSGVRIEAPIPNKAAVGIEVPNRHSATVRMRGILDSQPYKNSTSPLTLPLGKDIAGTVQVADLTRMPHLLVAGATGSGKSVCINSFITSILYRASPEEVQLILIDPKVVELSEYNDVPHLRIPVVTEPRKAAGALGSAVAEMDRRYLQFAAENVRDIKQYNKMAETRDDLSKLPYIAIIIDELADLMMVAGKDVENYICRLAQKARAAGMHLIVATQRPSVDVITGLIKANIPARIAFAVSSQVDSRTILDTGGAERLLGMGDMLFLPVGAAKPIRVQGTYVTDEEIAAVIAAAKQGGGAEYDDEMIAEMDSKAPAADNGSGDEGDYDPLLDKAIEAVIDASMASTSLLQRRLKLGYSRAGRIMDQLEELHVIGPFEGSKPRQVLITTQQWQEMRVNRAGDKQ